MSQATNPITGVNHSAQVEATAECQSDRRRSDLGQLALDYHWAKAMFEPAHTDDEINAADDQVKSIVAAIANARAKSIHDLRAKLAIFRLEEDGELSDHNALALIEGLTTDLDEWPASDVSKILEGPGLHGRHYDAYLSSVAAVRVFNDNTTASGDDARDAAFSASSELFDDLMECPADTLSALLLKIRAAHHHFVNCTEGSTISPRGASELFAIIAADLEIMMRLPGAGRAVQS